MKYETDSERSKYYYRWVYDISYWLLIDVITMNIFFGIILDTFAELRN